MGSLFAKKAAEPEPKQRATEQDKAILKIKSQQNKLKQYQRKIFGLLESEKTKAKEALAKNDVNAAKLILRRKKYKENLVAKTSQQIENLQEMVDTIEFASIEATVVQGIEQGNRALAALRQQLDVDDIADIMQDAADLQAWTDEVSNMLGEPIDDIDEDALQKEYDELLGDEEGEAEEEELPDLPEVPTHPLLQHAEDEEAASKPKAKSKAEPALVPA